jgi:hypothetical protein
VGSVSAKLLAGLLRLELIELSLLTVDLGLLGGHLTLYVGFLILPRLHLIADQSAAEKTHGRTDAGAGARVAGGATDNRTQAGTG